MSESVSVCLGVARPDPRLRPVARVARAAGLCLVALSTWLAPADAFAQTLSKTTLSLGQQVVGGTTAPKSLTFKNTLAVPVTISSVLVSGADAGDFSATPGCVLPAMVAPGKNCVIAVRLTPSALGARSATLIFTHDSPASPQSVALTGTGVVPVGLSPLSLSFGSFTLGATSATKTATVTNVQASPLLIASITTTSGFVKVGGTCPISPAVLAGGASCSIPVAFAPTVAGMASGVLTVIHNANNSPQTVSLSGNGFAPLTVSPSSLAFPSRTIGTTAGPKTVTLTNKLSTSVALSSVTASGDFAISSSTCGASLAAGAKCSVGVTFSPTAVGNRSGLLSVAHGAFGSPFQVGLSATGNVNGLLSIAVTPANPSVPAGQTLALVATGTFSSGGTAVLTTAVAWGLAGSSPGVARISNAAGSQGIVSVFNPGTATVSATLSSIAGSTFLTVTNAVPIPISVTPAGTLMGLGTTQPFTAVATYANGTTDVTGTAIWGTAFPSRGTVTTGGLYTALATGSNAVTADISQGHGSATVMGAGPTQPRRTGTTATKLPDGRVLFAGGYDNVNPSAGTELFDPIAGTFSAAAPMGTAREGHTATLLPDGRVLVAGGFGASNALFTAEIFNPATGMWTPTGSMNVRRGIHTATVVGTKVLVAGGINGSSLGSAELFNPATGTWAFTGSLTARRAHSATLLPDGRVLVSGGYGAAPLVTAELYNPVTGLWTPTGSMATARYLHTATLLANDLVLIAGGSIGSAATSSAELFDTVTGTWSTTGSLAVPAVSHTATLIPSGQVLVAGGMGTGNDSRVTAVYDPATGTFARGPLLTDSRWDHSAVLLNSGLVLLTGGNWSGTTAELRNGGVVLSSVTVLPFSRTVATGASTVFIARATFSDGSSADVTSLATWSVTPGTVATVLGPGTLKAVGPGMATVTASLGDFTFSATLFVH